MTRNLTRALLTVALLGAATSAFATDIYVIENSGFFNASGITPGSIGRFDATTPGSVTIVGNAGNGLTYNGLDFRPNVPNGLFAFEAVTNSIRQIGLSGGQQLLDSVGNVDRLVSDIAFSADGTRVYVAGNVSAFGRIVEADAATGEVLSVHSFVGYSLSGLATVPTGAGLPFPPDELWAISNTTGSPQLIRIDLATDSVMVQGSILGLNFNQGFEVGLDWAADGTLYAAFQGFNPQTQTDISSRLYRINPFQSVATLVGVIQSDFTWDVGGLAVDDRVFEPGDLSGDGCVDLSDLGVLLGCWGQFCGDLDGDSTTGLSDLGILLGNYNGGCP